jgi:malonate-semialdehyde dehydrogenase (acetylating)/methylmalonate-semialdehyde dehydrogenase
MTNVVSHWINNKAYPGTGGTTAPVTNPATGEVTGQVALGSVEDARAVIDAAAAAFPAWRDTSLAKRTTILFNFRELLNARKDELARIITAEHGKVVSDALGEVSRGQEVVEFACGIPHLLKGGFTENASTKVDVYSIRQPLGPVGVISPFNFPAMVPMWFFPIAIAAGNTVVLKPSEKDPSASLWMAELWAEAGLPPGVFNVLQGDKTVVDELLTNPAIKAISFVGSTPIAKYVYSTGTAHDKRVQALGGAKNHAVILPDADLDLAADAMVNAGFGSAGERCMAISAAVAVGPIADELVAKIAERAATIKTGDGTRDADMGPLVTKAHRDKVASYIDAGETDGAKIVVDGRHVYPDGGPDGFWLGPTLIDHVTPQMSVYTDEIFGPVLIGRTRRHLRRSSGVGQLQPLRQRHRDLHQRRRRRAEVPERGAGRHGRHQRADPGSDGVLQLRRLEGLAVRGQPRPRHRRRALLHPRQGDHQPLARSQPRRHRTRLPAERLRPRFSARACVSVRRHAALRGISRTLAEGPGPGANERNRRPAVDRRGAGFVLRTQRM